LVFLAAEHLLELELFDGLIDLLVFAFKFGFVYLARFVELIEDLEVFHELVDTLKSVGPNLL